MKHIIVHWTAGAYAPSNLDRQHYHRMIDGFGTVYNGNFPISANVPPLERGKYAAHAAHHNSWAIGVAICAMHGAKESPFDAGRYPIRQAQVDALVELCADLCREYDISVENVKCHSELPRQAGKWDINWLPGMSEPDKNTGSRIRAMIADKLAPPPEPWWLALIQSLMRIIPWNK